MARLQLTNLEIIEDLDEKPLVQVVLSKRNLLALLHKVDQDWSQKTITNDYIYVNGELLPPEVVDFVIIAEPDEEHYADRDAPPGPMIDRTEAFIVASTATPSA